MGVLRFPQTQWMVKAGSVTDALPGSGLLMAGMGQRHLESAPTWKVHVPSGNDALFCTPNWGMSCARVRMCQQKCGIAAGHGPSIRTTVQASKSLTYDKQYGQTPRRMLSQYCSAPAP